MAFAVWLLVAFVYWFIGVKVAQWQTISRLGHWSEAPILFTRKSYLYYGVVSILFMFLISYPFFLGEVPSFLIGVTLVLGLVVSIKGRQAALNHYREMLQEILSMTDGQEKEDIEKELNMTDMQILNQLKEQEELQKLISRAR